MVEPTKALIPVAGQGTRFMPYTKGVPKEMLAIWDRPVIHRVVEECVTAGLTDVVLVTSPNKASIEQYFRKDAQLAADLDSSGRGHLLEGLRRVTAGARIRSVPQTGRSGSGAAVLSAAAAVGDEPFLLLWGDELFVNETDRARQLVGAYAECGGPVVGLQLVAPAAASSYGMVALGDQVRPGLFALTDIVEKPAPGEAPSSFATVGGYVMTPDIFGALAGCAADQPDGEIHLTDAIRRLLLDRPVFGVVLEGRYLDVGGPENYFGSLVEFALADPTIRPLVIDRVRQALAEHETE